MGLTNSQPFEYMLYFVFQMESQVSALQNHKQSVHRSLSTSVMSHDFHFFCVSVFLSLPARLFLSNSPYEPADALPSEIPIPDSQSPPPFCPQ